MPDITITLTDLEYKALAWAAVDPQFWVENFTKNRAAAAIDDIYQQEVQRMMNDPQITSMPTSKEAVVSAANIQSAAERNAEALANMPLPPGPPDGV
jgi:hypothetical protein